MSMRLMFPVTKMLIIFCGCFLNSDFIQTTAVYGTKDDNNDNHIIQPRYKNKLNLFKESCFGFLQNRLGLNINYDQEQIDAKYEEESIAFQIFTSDGNKHDIEMKWQERFNDWDIEQLKLYIKRKVKILSNQEIKLITQGGLNLDSLTNQQFQEQKLDLLHSRSITVYKLQRFKFLSLNKLYSGPMDGVKYFKYQKFDPEIFQSVFELKNDYTLDNRIVQRQSIKLLKGQRIRLFQHYFHDNKHIYSTSQPWIIFQVLDQSQLVNTGLEFFQFRLTRLCAEDHRTLIQNLYYIGELVPKDQLPQEVQRMQIKQQSEVFYDDGPMLNQINQNYTYEMLRLYNHVKLPQQLLQNED